MSLTLEDLFRQLSYGELSNLAAALEASGGIKKERQNQIVQFANDGLKMLHSRLPLNMVDDLTQSLTAQEQNITLDSDVIVVESIFTPWGVSLPIMNVPTPGTLWVYQGTLHLPSLTSRMPGLRDIPSSGIPSVQIQITYRKRHAVLQPVYSVVAPVSPPLAQVITLPPELEQALRFYIASRVYGGMNTQEALAISASYRAQYEQCVQEALAQGIINGEAMPMSKLEQRGFV